MKSEYLKYALRQLEALVRIPSPTGFTEQAARYCFYEFANLGYIPTLTQKDGVMVCLGGQENPVLLGAHIDTLGAMVKEVKSNGRLRAAKIGGLQANNAETENIIVHARNGKTFSGTFQLENASVHVNGEYDQTLRTFDNIEVVLDEKVKTAEDVRSLGINVGDFITLSPRFCVTESGFIKSRFLDDKLSAAILLTYAKYLKDEQKQPSRKVYVDFTTFEEVGHGGACIPEDVNEMISVDMGCVGDGLQCDETKVSICVMDSQGPCNRTVVNNLVEAAERAKVQYALDVYPRYGSDADVALRAGHDIRHCVVGAGVYASHGYERSHIEGLANTFDLLCSYLG